jgi:hypothetical protein
MRKAPFAERRAHVRYSQSLGLACRPLGQASASWSATIRDLSHTGAALAMSQEVRPGAVLVVTVDGLGGRFARPLLMRVLNVRSREDGERVAGCAFVTRLSDDDVQSLMLVRRTI